MKPVQLLANQPVGRFYRGGDKIAAFRRTGSAPVDAPEDWVASTTTMFGESSLGLTRLPGGELLADAINREPETWLGSDHLRAFGTDTGLLVKLLDAGQRLPVHAHPDVPFARKHLATGHGKTEAWIFLEPGTVHLGFTRDIATDELRQWVDDQDANAMLDAMHTLQVEEGDAVLVPAGMPHAIGAGCFLLELQEPTDLSILLEWDGFKIDGRRDGHLGLGHQTALTAVNRTGRTSSDIKQLRTARADDAGELFLGFGAFFRAERSRGGTTWEPGYSVVVVTSGSGWLVDESGHRLELRSGDTLLVPFAAGEFRCEGGSDLTVVRCRPPQP